MKMLTKLNNFISKHPRMIIGGILLITIFFAFQLRNIKTDEDMSRMFPPVHPVSIYTAKVNELFSEKSKTIIIGIYNEKGIFNRETLEKIQHITERLKRLDKVIEQEVIGITSVDNIIGVPEGIKIEPLVKSTAITVTDAVKAKTEALTNKLIVGNLISRTGPLLS